jgi:hypothetical protein
MSTMNSIFKKGQVSTVNLAALTYKEEADDKLPDPLPIAEPEPEPTPDPEAEDTTPSQDVVDPTPDS